MSQKRIRFFPHFLTTHLPPGVAGIIMAALLGAAMCALASDLNSFSAVGVTDIYRLLRPLADDRKRLRVGKFIVAGSGVACMAMAVALAQTKGSVLSMWFTVSEIASGGLAGLFMLAFLTPRSSRGGVYAGVAAMVIFTAWASLTLPGKRVVDLGPYNFPWHDYMIGAIGHLILFAFGYVASLLDRDAPDASLGEVTLWRWLRTRNIVPNSAAR